MTMTAPHVYQAIHAISAHMAAEGIAKTQTNQAQKYKFRGIDQVMNALAPLLVKHHLVIIPRYLSRSRGERTTNNGGTLFFTTLRAEFDFVSAIDGSKHTAAAYGEGMDSADKSCNKAMAAAYKYAAFQTFCIPTEGDGDLDADYYTPKQGGDVLPAQPANAPLVDKIETVAPMQERPAAPAAKPTTSQRAIAASKKPADKPPTYKELSVQQRSHDAAKKLLEGDAVIPGLITIATDLGRDGVIVADLEEKLKHWGSAYRQLKASLTDPVDFQQVQDSYKSLRKALDDEAVIRSKGSAAA